MSRVALPHDAKAGHFVDVGSCTGAVTIEAARDAGRVTAIERKDDRLTTTEKTLAANDVDAAVELRNAEAPDGLPDDAEEDTTVHDGERETVYGYLEKGGTANVANCLRYLADEYSGESRAYDDPVTLPTEAVYHPDYPGATYEDLRANLDPDTPTVAVWFYESHWTHENITTKLRWGGRQVTGSATAFRNARRAGRSCHPSRGGTGPNGGG